MAVGDLQKRVGRNLRAHRQALGLSQEAFADVTGVHRTYMGGLERGEGAEPDAAESGATGRAYRGGAGRAAGDAAVNWMTRPPVAGSWKCPVHPAPATY